MIQIICCSSLLSAPGGRAFSRDFTIILAPECRAFSGAFNFSKGAMDTND